MIVGGNVSPAAGRVNDAEPNGVVAVRGIFTTGFTGSLLVTVRVHAFGPAEVGVKLTPTSSSESALIVAGNSPGFTSVKSAHEMTAEVTMRPQGPTLLSFSVCGGALPPQTAVPKSPLPVTLIVPLPSSPLRGMKTSGLTGSSL